jgi:hypothetical protein
MSNGFVGLAEAEVPAWALPLLALPEALADLNRSLAKLAGTAAELVGEEADSELEIEEPESHHYAPEPPPINQADAEMRAHRKLQQSEHAAYQERQRRLSGLWGEVGASPPGLVFDKAKLGWRD